MPFDLYHIAEVLVIRMVVSVSLGLVQILYDVVSVLVNNLRVFQVHLRVMEAMVAEHVEI